MGKKKRKKYGFQCLEYDSKLKVFKSVVSRHLVPIIPPQCSYKVDLLGKSIEAVLYRNSCFKINRIETRRWQESESYVMIIGTNNLESVTVYMKMDN